MPEPVAPIDEVLLQEWRLRFGKPYDVIADMWEQRQKEDEHGIASQTDTVPESTEG